MPAHRSAALAAGLSALCVVAAACGGTAAGGGGSAAPESAAAHAQPAPTTNTESPRSSAQAGSTAGPGSGGAGPGAAVPSDWTTYQDSADHQGVAAPPPPATPLRPAWTASLDGSAVYGQPLYYQGRIIVATEDDHVYSLDARSGRVVWAASLGAPLRHVASAAGCGDIDPLGVTSTPVIDAATGIVYVLAEVSVGGHPPVEHRLVGIDIRTGRTTLDVDADPPLPTGEDPVRLLQRAALSFGNGRVYIGYGGQFGDCGLYHGWLVAVRPTSPSRIESFDVTPRSTGGAIWDGGSGPVLGPSGSVYVTTGNPDSPGPAPWAEAVVKLGAGLATPPEAVFQDPAASGDLDLSTGGAVLLPGGTVFAVGKTQTGYLLRSSDLRLLGTVRGICGSDPDGGSAFNPVSDDLYVPCSGGGIQQVQLARRITGWRSTGGNSTPVLAGDRLWALDYHHAAVVGIDPATGRVVARVATGRPLPHFASLSVANGLVVVPTMSGVVAFR